MNIRRLAGRLEAGAIQARGTPLPEQKAPPGNAFAALLEQATGGVSYSAHARQRIEQRGISMTDTDLQAIRDAMTTLESKGARDALLVRSDAAFVVNVPSRTVVTALPRHEMQHRAFTSIDSAMLI